MARPIPVPPSRAIRRASILVCIALVAALSESTPSQATTPSWSFSVAPTHPTLATEGRIFAAMAAEPDGHSVVLYGGDFSNVSALYGDTWTDDGNGWVPRCGTPVPGADAPCGPGTRVGHGLASTDDGVILFGGLVNGDFDSGNGSVVGDTWRWNGSSWTQLCADGTCGPAGRFMTTLAGNGPKAVLYGGAIPSQGVTGADTWVWDGSTWTQTCGDPLPTPCGPGPRAAASMAWDGSHFVMFGGIHDVNGAVAPPNDSTWVFDGTTWSEACGTDISEPCGPPARELSTMADAHTTTSGPAALLAAGGDLFTGSDPQTFYRDAWAWNGTTWNAVTAPWSAAPLSVPANGDPPDQTQPIIQVMAPRRATCEVESFGSSPANSATQLRGTTYLAGIDAFATGRSTGCAPVAATAPPTPEAVATPEPPGWLVFAKFLVFARVVAFWHFVRFAKVIVTHRTHAAPRHRR